MIVPVLILQKIEEDRAANSSYGRRTEGGCGLHVGCDGIEYRIRADTLQQLKNLVGGGMPLDLACEHAKAYARSLIKSHNYRRPKDLNWQRWEGTADTAVENIQRFSFSLMSDPMFN